MISREKMIALYSAMVKYRMLAEQTEELMLHGKAAASWRLAEGREATIAGITADLRADDTLIAAQSGLLASFVNGHAQGKASRNGHGNGVVSFDLAVAIDAAKEHRGAKKGAVTLAFCEERVKAKPWRKQLKRASKGNLPLILVRLPKDKSSGNGHGIAPEALEFGVPMIAVDAGDVRAVYRVASESIARARQGRGPTLIDCVDFGSREADPICALETVLAKKRVLNAGSRQEIESSLGREVKVALRRLSLS